MIRRIRNRWLVALANIAVVGATLYAVSFLPPDNSLADVRKTGVLKLCVPEEFPPLAQKNPDAPGYDIEIMRKIADDIGVRLLVNVMTSMGKDYNPRNWRLTRGQCNVIAGGLADTAQTRVLLQTIPTDIETGWVGIAREAKAPEAGSTWAVWPGSSGTDRLALSAWLKERGARGRLVNSPAEIPQLLESGQIQGALMERLAATALNLSNSFITFWLPEDNFPQNQMALGFWKGDQTLYRAANSSFTKMCTRDYCQSVKLRYGLPEIGAILE